MYLQIVLKRSPTGPRKDKPHRLPLPHPLYTKGQAEVCLFVKDHKGEGQTAARASHGHTPGITKIIGLSALRKKYESHESKRNLCDAYEIFLADDRVLPSLPKLIGKKFFKLKKQPVPVTLKGKDWSKAIAEALGSTYVVPPLGCTVSIRVAKASMTAEEVAANILAVVTRVVDVLPRGRPNLQAVYLKSAESVALPLYLDSAPAVDTEEEAKARAGRAEKARDRTKAGQKGLLLLREKKKKKEEEATKEADRPRTNQDVDVDHHATPKAGVGPGSRSRSHDKGATTTTTTEALALRMDPDAVEELHAAKSALREVAREVRVSQEGGGGGGVAEKKKGRLPTGVKKGVTAGKVVKTKGKARK